MGILLVSRLGLFVISAVVVLLFSAVYYEGARKGGNHDVNGEQAPYDLLAAVVERARSIKSLKIVDSTYFDGQLSSVSESWVLDQNVYTRSSEVSSESDSEDLIYDGIQYIRLRGDPAWHIGGQGPGFVVSRGPSSGMDDALISQAYRFDFSLLSGLTDDSDSQSNSSVAHLKANLPHGEFSPDAAVEIWIDRDALNIRKIAIQRDHAGAAMTVASEFSAFDELLELPVKPDPISESSD